MRISRNSRPVSPVALAALVAVAAVATGAGAATIHRFDVSQTAGSGGATTFLQTDASKSALQGENGASARTSIQIPFGVLGEYDNTTSTFGIGVAGISSTGYGVGAEAFSSAAAAIAINAGTGPGLQANGYANDGIDGYTQADQFAGVYGEDDSPDGSAGVFGYSSGEYGFGLAGVGGGDAAGVLGFSPDGVGGFFDNDSATAEIPSLQVSSITPGTELFDAQVEGTDGGVYETMALQFPSANASGTVLNDAGGSSDLQVNGDILITGEIKTGCKTFPETAPTTDCGAVVEDTARGSRGTMVTSYGSHESSPTVEDAGEARLVNGYAHVTLDSAFTAAISQTQPYLVFPAPQGDSRGLYVTNRTPAGFDVRENGNGRSTLTFDYRIVAKQFGRDAKHMAFATARTQGRGHRVSAATTKRFQHLRTLGLKHRATARPKPFANLPGMRISR